MKRQCPICYKIDYEHRFVARNFEIEKPMKLKLPLII